MAKFYKMQEAGSLNKEKIVIDLEKIHLIKRNGSQYFVAFQPPMAIAITKEEYQKLLPYLEVVNKDEDEVSSSKIQL